MGGLFNSTILEVVVGLIFVYLLLAIICTAANEWIAGLLSARSKVLSRALLNLLGSQPLEEGGAPDGLVRKFYEHPIIKGMMRDEGKHFAYLPARTFSQVLLDLATPGDGVTSPDAGGRVAPSDIREAIRNMPDGDVKKTLQALLKGVDDTELAGMQRVVEGWFEDMMDRATGWYKRRTQVWTVIVAAVVTLLSNADSIQIGRRLWTDPAVRAAVVEEAKVRSQKPRPSITVEYPDEDDPTNPVVTDTRARSEGDVLSGRERELLGKLIGWQQSDVDNWTWWPGFPQRLVGWSLTILAVSLGAPFWFDVLNKFMHVRSAGKSPDEAAKRPEKQKMPPEDRTA